MQSVKTKYGRNAVSAGNTGAGMRRMEIRTANAGSSAQEVLCVPALVCVCDLWYDIQSEYIQKN